MIPNTMSLFATLSINDIQHNDSQLIALSASLLIVTNKHIKMSVIMLSVVMLNIIMLSVVAPFLPALFL